MGKKTYIDTSTRMKLIKRNVLNSLFRSEGRTAKNSYSGYSDLIVSLFSSGLDSYIAIAIISVQDQANQLVFDNNPAGYFAALDAILNNTDPPQIITLTDPNLLTYYGIIPTPTTFYAFSGTVFPLNILDSLVANTYIMIPSTYLITIGPNTYRTLGTGATSKLSINGALPGLSIGQTYTINTRTYRFVAGGSPSISLLTECYTDPILDGGLNSDIPTIFVDAGELTDTIFCYIDGGNLGS